MRRRVGMAILALLLAFPAPLRAEPGVRNFFLFFATVPILAGVVGTLVYSAMADEEEKPKEEVKPLPQQPVLQELLYSPKIVVPADMAETEAKLDRARLKLSP